MTWTKISDDFPDDCETLSDRAFRLHVEGLVWSNRKLLNCEVPKEHLRRFATSPQAVDELLACGWWSEDGDVYVIRHHATYQQSREEVLARQERARKNGAKSPGRPPKPKKPRSVTDVGSQPGSDEDDRQPADTAQNPAPHAQKPTSVPQVGTQVETHRDGTGQAVFRGDATTDVGQQQGEWPAVRRCVVCGSPLDPRLPDDSHPSCAFAA